MMKSSYTIEARSYNIAGIASHNFWVLRQHEHVVSQLHGLATDRKTNQFIPIGIFSDRLGFYVFDSDKNEPNFISKAQQFMTIYQGDQDDVLMRWQKAVDQIKPLNQRDINYSPFGVFGFPITNSNSAFHLFAQLMGFECYHFSGILELGINNSLDYCLVQ